MTDDDKALVERLEALAVNSEGQDDWLVMSDAADRIEALSAENKRLRDLLSRNIDDEPCYYDHHGYCQAHYIEEDCSVAAARAALGEQQ